MTQPILAVQRGDNASLLITATTIHPFGERILDMTPGTKLGFWKRGQPAGLTLLPAGVDFRDTQYPACSFTDVVFDPPYVAKGGHKTSTIGEMNERYGMLHVEKNPTLQWERQIVPGIAEAARLLERRGRLWFKVMDYVTNGSVYWFAKLALGVLAESGLLLVDEFILDGKPGPQPKVNLDGSARVQRHARRAHSNLLVAVKR